jgi:hypothetical protein
MLDGFLAFLENSALAGIVGGTAGVYPAISALHVIGIALLVGPIILIDLRLMGLMRQALGPTQIALLIRAAILGFALAALTGIALFSVQALKYGENPAIAVKFALILMAGANALALRRFGGGGLKDHGRNAALFGAASLILWLGAVFAGRWIAFV